MPLPFTGESYFDYPDGENLGKKLWITVKNTAAVSAGISIVDVLLYSHPKGYAATLGRIASISAPIIGLSSIFVVITNQAANYRKKDDKLNWVIGGVATGIACGAWRRSGMVGFCSSVLFGTYAFIQKDALMMNIPLFDVNLKLDNGGLRTVKQDWTLTADRPGNWTTGK
ncbi:hypothetical protein RI129_002633 [Pyrocoelia pectoralis]|uniref:NADH dehydrogenase [ubiquinone] 1 alpha subcomplex subunit 11 n=1 Tax=Pyrocoelia pectoralis TaxID=417401 RepID=A0AAN7VM03_9COLE